MENCETILKRILSNRKVILHRGTLLALAEGISSEAVNVSDANTDYVKAKDSREEKNQLLLPLHLPNLGNTDLPEEFAEFGNGANTDARPNQEAEYIQTFIE